VFDVKRTRRMTGRKQATRRASLFPFVLLNVATAGFAAIDASQKEDVGCIPDIGPINIQAPMLRAVQNIGNTRAAGKSFSLDL